MAYGFLGMRGTGDWVTDQRPKNWREMILKLYPNGDAPLTALLAKMESEGTDDPEFNWWTKILPAQGGALTDVYSDAAMTIAYVEGAGAALQTVYVKCALAVADEFRAGHQVLLRDASDYRADVNGKVTGVVLNGANSMISVMLLEADDNSAGHVFDRILIIGNINAEGAEMPDAIAYDPVKHYNYTQIFRTPLEITRTAKKTRLRTGDQYKQMKTEALELHSIEMEKAMIWGIRTERTGSNGKPERTTGGILSFLSTNRYDYTLDTDYATTTWLNGGWNWLMNKLEVIFRYGKTEKLAFCGSGALLGLNFLAENKGDMQITPSTKAYGIQVMEWITPFGTIYLKRHPLFSYEASNRNSILIVEPRLLKYRYVDDTFFKPDENMKKGSWHNRDGIKEEYLTECGLELHHEFAMGYLNGVGLPNTLVP